MGNSFLGYNFASPIRGNLIPQRLQNLCIRDYAQSSDLALAFCVSEYFDSDKARMLFVQFDHIESIAGFIFYSLELLPAVDARRQEFYERLLSAGKEVHFALERLAIKSRDDVTRVDHIYRIMTDRRLHDIRKELVSRQLLDGKQP